MRFIIFILLFFGFVLFVSGQKARPPHTAPLNPEYLKTLKTKGPDALDSAWHLPYSPSFNALSKSGQKHLRSTLPPSYDMRTAGPGGTPLLTPIKYQGGCGSCWAFSSVGSIEATWMLKGYGAYDLSENNVKNCHGFLSAPCGYGSNFHTTALFARGQGPYLEADDPYSTTNGVCAYGLTPVKLLSQVLYIPPDVEAMKEAIFQYGGVSVPIRLVDIDPANYTHFNTLITSTNHLISLVGWDDNMEVTGGLISAYPPRGAFIVRNSYGTGWGESGYFYISYYDIQVLDYGVCWPGWETYIPGTEVHTRSRLGSFSSIGYDSPTGYGLVKLKLGSDQQLVRLGTYLNASMAEISFEIYDDFDTTNLILSNKLLEHKNEYCHYPGYYTFELPVSLNFADSNEIYIKVKYYTPGYPWPIPIETYMANFMDPVIDTNVCWVSDNGADSSWYLLGGNTPAKYDLCVYAYTEKSTSWHGNSNTAWANAANWSNGIPDSNAFAIIPDTTNQPIISGTARCRGLIIESLADLTISPAGSLTIDKELNVAGNLNQNGNLTVNQNANIIYSGTVAQQLDAAISGAENLIIDNPSGITLQSDLNIEKMLEVKAGNINAGSYSISYADGAKLKYSGNNAQNTSNAEFPASNGPSLLHIDNPAGVGLHAARTIDSTLILESGVLNNSSNNLSLAAEQEITRYRGSLSAAPVFGSSINLNYRSDTTIGTGFEIPASSTVAQRVLINCPDTIRLNSSLTINTSLELNQGIFDNSTSSLSLASGTDIISRTGNLSSTPTFNSSVDIFYLGDIADTTGHELPVSTSVLKELYMRNSEGVLLNADATINENLYLVSGTFNNSSHTLSIANNCNITVAPGLLDGDNGIIGKLSSKPSFGSNVNLEYAGRYGNVTGVEMPDSSDLALNNLSMNNYTSLWITKNLFAKGTVSARGKLRMGDYSISGTGNLDIRRQAIVHTNNAYGIDNTNGVFQMAGTVSYNDTIDFYFEGSNAQLMGINIPPKMRHLVIDNSHIGGVTLQSKDIRVMGNMVLQAGSLFNLKSGRRIDVD